MTDTETISRETHAALLDKAVRDATAQLTADLAAKTSEATELASKVSELTASSTTLTEDNARLNRELDTAQVTLRAATDEVAALKADIATKDEAARRTEIASARAAQVRTLGFFDEKYVEDKASAWAGLADEDWASRLDEWRALKPEAVKAEGTVDAASAMTGTTGTLTTAPVTSATTTPARRSVLGLS